MSSTATTYINNIDKNFPIPGRDNDSQGFRDNWINITEALDRINTQADYIEAYAVLTTSTTSTFFGNTIADVTIQNASTKLWDNGTVTGDVEIDYSLGSYQKVTLGSGVHNITIINWPGAGTAGDLKLAITPLSASPTTVNFVDASPLGPSTNPYVLGLGTNIFELYSEYPLLAAANTVYVRLVNELIVNSTTASNQSANTFTFVSPTLNASLNHKYSISGNTGSTYANVVTSVINANSIAANVALTPNFVKSTIVSAPTANPGDTTASIITLGSVNGIIVGATFNVISTNTILTVNGINSVAKTVSTNPYFPVGIGSGVITFKNPSFNDYADPLATPLLATMADSAATTNTGVAGRFKGSIQASVNRLEVTYNDYGNGNPNTFVAQTLAVTTATNNSTDLASTNFVHKVLPYGSIIMWYGAKSTVPSGWAVCDGTNSTPDLTNVFLVGAGADSTSLPSTTITGTTATTGGRADTVLPLHDHDTSDPGHSHSVEYFTATGGSSPTATGTTIGTAATTQPQFTDLVVLSTGTSDVSHTNIPPFKAIYYIMKVTG